MSVDTIVILAVQFTSAAFFIGIMYGKLNGIKGELKRASEALQKCDKDIDNVHKRMTDHVQDYHTTKTNPYEYRGKKDE